jgi:hypothetical protein
MGRPTILRAGLELHSPIMVVLGFTALLGLGGLAGCGGVTGSPTAQHSVVPATELAPGASRSATSAPTPPPSSAPTASPTFVTTGNMNVPRMDATATLLRDGRVLIAGGSPVHVVPFDEVVSSAELYDPATGKFTPTGSMAAARSHAAAILLRDGRVLIAGGYGCLDKRQCTPGPDTTGANELASAELYDPATGRFSHTGSMSLGRVDVNALLLPGGSVLIFGGGDSRVEVYDPRAGKFSSDGSLLNQYATATATLLPDGIVLVIGARENDSGPGAELFDPASGRSTSTSFALPASISAADGPETATALQDGHVLLCIDDYLVTYDPATGSSTMSGSISNPNQWSGPTATALPDGRVLFEGGVLVSPDGTALSTAQSAGLYDPTNGFRMVGSLNEPRTYQTATVLSDGMVLIAGGTRDAQEATSSAELFRPS